ncbi:2-haloacid dehalogenase [Halopolyspora algeriensis]|uniref:2-haloacid dehalogenase n=1 Tax=Halopolyspora algeriensis TaxID=1500506 RepID=A0A368VXE6_9ACTN|nr:haloacid dehalogenase type II [Halopolyspora algeriensis]RCW45987.1 2-haloacid dehalogenase [Halopolyspora algeriensis]TQM55400.1 2-haloacid dehalogenase [Halopolyspora algeriensis]
MAADIEWVVFDLNGTVLDPSGISAELPEPFDTESVALGLLDEAVQQAMVDTAVGQYRPFTQYLRAALTRRLLLAGIDTVQPHVETALDAVGRLRAFPEVPAALDALRRAGFRVAAITNSVTGSAEATLESAGIGDYFESVVGSDQARAYKPAAVVYETGLARIGTEPSRACMVAAHGWDMHGAKAAGMVTAWVRRKEGMLLDTVNPPDFSGGDVAEVGDHLAGHSSA